MTTENEKKDEQLRQILDACRREVGTSDLRITNRSNSKQFKLVISTKTFRKQDFIVKTNGARLIVEALSENKASDSEVKNISTNSLKYYASQAGQVCIYFQDTIRQSMTYEHLLPSDINPVSLKTYFPNKHQIEISADRRDQT